MKIGVETHLIFLFAYRQTSSSYPSPKGEGRCCIANPNCITTTSTLYLYSTISEMPIIIVSPKSEGCALFLSFGEVR
jgi:hypothetical protein